MTHPNPDNTAPIALYGPKAVALGIGASIVGAAFGAVMALAAGAQGDSLMGGGLAAGLLVASWLLAWGVAFLTGPYQMAAAGMAWLALSTARLLVLIVAGIALALAAPTMGLGLWLALMAGGLAAVAIDCAMALRSFRRHQPAGMDLETDLTSGGMS